MVFRLGQPAYPQFKLRWHGGPLTTVGSEAPFDNPYRRRRRESAGREALGKPPEISPRRCAAALHSTLTVAFRGRKQPRSGEGHVGDRQRIEYGLGFRPTLFARRAL